MIDKLEIHTTSSDEIQDYWDPKEGRPVTDARPSLQHENIWFDLNTKVTAWKATKRSLRGKEPPCIWINDKPWWYVMTRQYIPTETAHMVLKNFHGSQLWIMPPGNPSEAGIRLILSPCDCNQKCIDEIYTKTILPIELAFGIRPSMKRWKTERIDLATDGIFAHALTPGMISVDANQKLGTLLITHAKFEADNGEACKPLQGTNYKKDTAFNPLWGTDRKAHQLAGYDKAIMLVGQADKWSRCTAAGFTNETIGEALMKYIMGFGPYPTDQFLLRWEHRTGTDWLHARKFNTLQDLCDGMDRLIADVSVWRIAKPGKDQTRSRWRTATWWRQLMQPQQVHAEPDKVHTAAIPPEMARLRQVCNLHETLKILEDMGTERDVIERLVVSPRQYREEFLTSWAHQANLQINWPKPKLKQFMNAQTSAKRDAGPDVEFDGRCSDGMSETFRKQGFEWWKHPPLKAEIDANQVDRDRVLTEPFRFNPCPNYAGPGGGTAGPAYWNLHIPGIGHDGEKIEQINDRIYPKPTFNWKVKLNPKTAESAGIAENHAANGAGILVRPEKPVWLEPTEPLYQTIYEHRSG